MPNIAIITARGGSKRIPHKNLQPFCGKPILAYSIQAAQQSGLFEEVMVSTDDEQIAEIARQYGAKVPFYRSAATSSDYATTIDVMTEVLDTYAAQGQTFDLVCCIYPTAPFLTGPKLRAAYDAMAAAGADSAMPVVQFSFPPQRALVIRGGVLQYQYPQHAAARSQDLEPVYHDCGQFYMCTAAAFARYHTPITPQVVPLILPETEVQDIDTPADWAIAEAKYQAMLQRGAADVPSI